MRSVVYAAERFARQLRLPLPLPWRRPDVVAETKDRAIAMVLGYDGFRAAWQRGTWSPELSGSVGHMLPVRDPDQVEAISHAARAALCHPPPEREVPHWGDVFVWNLNCNVLAEVPTN